MLEILNLRATFKRALHFLGNLQMLTSANILGDLWKIIFAEFIFHEISWKYVKWTRIFRQLMERLQNMRNNAAGDGETNCRFSSQPNTKSYSVRKILFLVSLSPSLCSPSSPFFKKIRRHFVRRELWLFHPAKEPAVCWLQQGRLYKGEEKGKHIYLLSK